MCPPDIAGAGNEETAAAPSAAAPAPLRKFLLFMVLLLVFFFAINIPLLILEIINYFLLAIIIPTITDKIPA
jgi:hypothetical protein